MLIHTYYIMSASLLAKLTKQQNTISNNNQLQHHNYNNNQSKKRSNSSIKNDYFVIGKTNNNNHKNDKQDDESNTDIQSNNSNKRMKTGKHDNNNNNNSITVSNKNHKSIKSKNNPQQISKYSKDVLASKLLGSEFRYLNEQLYTINSNDAYNLYQSQPELYERYHRGYSIQVEQWPNNPLDVYIKRLLDMSKYKQFTVADMGCGRARLAYTLIKQHQTKHTIYSFDLVSNNNELITACNISHTPLQDNICDIVIFCLSLMGTDWIEFIKEAYRILKVGGQLWITEVKSRFEHSDVNDRNSNKKHNNTHTTQHGTSEQFVDYIQSIGFNKRYVNDKNTMFIQFEFSKIDSNKQNSRASKLRRSLANNPNNILKPCLYKRR